MTHIPAVKNQNPLRLAPLRHRQVVGRWPWNLNLCIEKHPGFAADAPYDPRPGAPSVALSDAVSVSRPVKLLTSPRKQTEFSKQRPSQVKAPSTTGFAEEGERRHPVELAATGLPEHPSKPAHLPSEEPACPASLNCQTKFSGVSII